MWFHYARTMIFWSRSYLCIYFPWNPLDFGDANSLKVYIFSLKPFGFWRRQFIESPYLYIYFPWNPLDFGDANSSKALFCIYIFPEALWILETPIHRKPLFVYILSLKPFGFWRRQHIESPCQQGDPLLPETLNPLDFLVPLKHWALHTSYYIHINRLTSARSCVMLGYPEAWGRGGGNPLSLETLEPLGLWSRWVNWGRKWIFAPLETLGPKLYYVGAPRGMG